MSRIVSKVNKKEEEEKQRRASETYVTFGPTTNECDSKARQERRGQSAKQQTASVQSQLLGGDLVRDVTELHFEFVDVVYVRFNFVDWWTGTGTAVLILILEWLVHACTHTHTQCTHACTHTRTHTQTQCTHACTRAHTHKHNAHMHVRPHTHAHTHTHTCLHTSSSSSPSLLSFNCRAPTAKAGEKGSRLFCLVSM